MNTVETFKALFPLKGIVTQKIIDHADITDANTCIGALTLGQALAAKGVTVNHMSWGDRVGSPLVDKEYIRITTEGRVSMMDIITPTEVTFILES